MVRHWDDEFDLVSVGSGAGGLVAATVAARLGGRALVVEKDDSLGGVTALSGGQLWIAPNRVARAQGLEDSPESALAYMDFLSAGAGDRETRIAYIERGDEALGEMLDAGLALALVPGLSDYYYPDGDGTKKEGRYLEVVPFGAGVLGEWSDRIFSSASAGMTASHVGSQVSHADVAEAGGDHERLAERIAERAARSERCMGAGLAANLVHVAVEHGVELRTKSPAVELLGDGAVEGVRISTPDGDLRIRARAGVVLATGGYDWNPELMETFELMQDFYSLTQPTVTGDHFALAQPFGAAIGTTLPQSTVRHVGLHIPGETWGGRDLVRVVCAGYPGSMLVNRKGRRFGDESFYRSYVSSLCNFDGHAQEFENWPAWFVFDQRYRDTYAIGSLKPGGELPNDFAHEGATPEDVAREAGIDPGGLADTVERMNRYAQTGKDLDFDRGSLPWSNRQWGDPRSQPNPNLGPIDTAPYYAVPLRRVGTGITSAGLKTDAAGRVLAFGGAPVQGLYALGNSAARTEMGAGYNSGLAIGRSLIFGYLAARDAFKAGSAAAQVGSGANG